MYLVDTNIFLEVMLAQARSGECKAFLNALRTGRVKAFVTDFSLYSIMVIMGRLSKVEELKTLISSLTAYRGFTLYRSKLTELVKAAEICAEKGLDIDDSIQYSAALSLNVKAIVSLDAHFDGLEIPRREPAQIVA